MPNWRKIVVSGSSASLNSVSVSNTVSCRGITGSLDTGSVRGGEYTPAYTNISNISQLTGYKCSYVRVGKGVSVSGLVLFDATSPSTNCIIAVSLPFSSSFSNLYECAGTAFGLPNLMGTVQADTTRNSALVTIRVGTTLSTTSSFIFNYTII